MSIVEVSGVDMFERLREAGKVVPADLLFGLEGHVRKIVSHLDKYGMNNFGTIIKVSDSNVVGTNERNVTVIYDFPGFGNLCHNTRYDSQRDFDKLVIGNDATEYLSLVSRIFDFYEESERRRVTKSGDIQVYFGRKNKTLTI